MRTGVLVSVIISILLFAIAPVFAAGGSSDLYEQGMEAFKSGNYGSARLIFKKVVDNDDDYKDRAWFHLALSVYKQKKYDPAIFELNRFMLACTTASLCSEARYWIAEANYMKRNYIKAIEEYNRFISQKSDSRLINKSYRRIGDIYFIQGRYDEAVLVWKNSRDEIVEPNEKNRLTIKIGEALFMNENYDEALETLNPLLALKSDVKISSSARLIIGRVWQIKEKHSDALRLFGAIPDSLLRKKPFYDALYYKSLSAAALRNTSSAKSYLESFLLIGKRSEWFHDGQYELGRIMLKEGKGADGINLLESVRTNTTKMELRSKAAMELAKIYLDRDPKAAIPYLEDSVSLSDPEEQKNALMLLSRVYIDVRKFEDAERLLDLLKSKYPYDSNMEEVQFLLSRVYLSRGDTAKAIEGFEQIRESNPFSKYIPESYYYLALANYGNDKKAKAVSLMQKYLEQRNIDNRFDAHARLCEWYIEERNYREAGKNLDSIARLFPNRHGIDEVIYSYGGKLYEKNPADRKYLQMVVSRYPQSVSAGKVLMMFGDEAYRAGQYRDSERLYRQYLSVEGRENASSVYLYRAISLYRLGRFAELVRVFEHEPVPQSEEFVTRLINLYRGKSYYQTGQNAKAYDIFKRYDPTSLSEGDLDVSAKIALASGDIAMAKRSVDLLRLNREKYAEGLTGIAGYYARENDLAVATSYYEKVIDECADTPFADRARLELAGIDYRRKQYQSAAARLEAITDAGLSDRKNALLVQSYFRTGRRAQATELLEANLQKLSRSPFGEGAFREALYSYYKKGDEKSFSRYSDYLKRYGGTSDYITHLSGRLNFNQEKFAASYLNFYRLSQGKSEYLPESLYHLGLITLMFQNNPAGAEQYFKKLIDRDGGTNLYALKSRLLLSIRAREEGNDATARDHLTFIIGNSPESHLRVQAMNLFEYYGYYRNR